MLKDSMWTTGTASTYDGIGEAHEMDAGTR
jgi:hypothetical protein